MPSPTEAPNRTTQRSAQDRSAPRRRPVVHRLLDLLLVVAGCLGALTALWWVLTLTLGLGLVTFATGSMTPMFPIGSLAVSAPEGLSQIRVGDVVTVDRGHGLLPITHRVVSVVVSGAHAELRLKGDANALPDPTPYRVDSVRRVLVPLPMAAGLIRFGSSPLGLGLAAALVTLCLLWAVRSGRSDAA